MKTQSHLHCIQLKVASDFQQQLYAGTSFWVSGYLAKTDTLWCQVVKWLLETQLDVNELYV